MATLSVMNTSARASILFASELPTGSRPSGAMLDAAVAATLLARGGTQGCVAAMAAAYGDYPETAAPRMRWALSVVKSAHGVPRPDPDRQLIAA
jgi:hypothetical protein